MVVVSLAALLRAPRALPPLGPPPTTPLRSLRLAFTSVVVLAVVVVDADLEREGADDDDDGEVVVVPLLFHP